MNAEPNFQYFRIDPPHIKTSGAVQNGYYRGTQKPINYNHININFGANSTEFQVWLQKQYNHYLLRDDAYAALKDLKATGKKVRVAGKILLVAGIALDALELGTTIDADLKDADRKLGKKTLSTAPSIGGAFGGDALGKWTVDITCTEGRLWAYYGQFSKQIFFPPRLPDTPVPDDWPPDGSLRFIECGDDPCKAIPSVYKNFEFSPNEDAYDDRIPKLSMEIMKRFCGLVKVLTKVVSDSDSVDAPDEKTLLIMERSVDPAIFWANRDIAATDYCFLDAYVLPENLNISDAKSAAQAVATGKYDVWFNLSGWGPCALHVTLNPETVDADALQEIVAAVCKENHILFQNPPQS